MSSSKWEQGRAYVEQLRGEGRTDEEIRQVMLESGWEEEQLDDLFAVGAPSPSAEPPPAPRESAAPTKRPVPASGPKPRSSTERTFCGVASVVCGLGTVVLLTIGILIFILALMGVLPGEVAYLGLLLGGLLPILIAFVLVLGAGLGVFAFVRGDRKWGGAGAGMCLALLAAGVVYVRQEQAKFKYARLSAGSAADIERELSEGADPNIHDSRDGDTPLHSAIAGDRLDAARALIDGGADPNEPNASGWTALHEAAGHARAEAARLLLDNGAEVDARNSGGDTPLLWAIRWGITVNDLPAVVGVLQVLLEHGADPNVENEHDEIALHCAADAGKDCPDVVALLIEHGANINAQDRYGCTALHNAAASGRLRVVEVLLDHGADLEVLDRQGYTPLGWAAARDHLEVARILLEAGADPNAEKVAPRHWGCDEMKTLLREYRAGE